MSRESFNENKGFQKRGVRDYQRDILERVKENEMKY